MSTACRPKELFSLDMLAIHLAGFQPPQGPHDPAGDWDLAYRQYSLADLAGFGSQQGMVRLSRRRRSDDTFALEVQCERRVFGQHTVKLAAHLEAHAQRLPVPTRWSWQSEIADLKGVAMPESQFKRTAMLQDNTMQLDGGRKRALAGPCTVSWLLFEAVGRLPRETFGPLNFTLVDQLDEIKLHHTLSYAQSLTVSVGQRPVRQKQVEQLEKGTIHKTVWGETPGHAIRLHAYHHLGDGIVPWVYWVDDQGRLLFAVAGLEAYALDSFGKA